MRSAVWSVLLPVALVLGAGCGGGELGEAVRPEAPSAAEAMGEETVRCGGVAQYGEPLVIDWKSNQRTDLELAMKDGVAVVSYDCDGFRLLKGCRVEGSYGYAGVSRKEDTLQLKSRDEIHANIPLSAASISAGLERGATIDVAVVMVGKRATTVGEVPPSKLEGNCEGATHIVRGAYLGAFALAQGSEGKVRAAAEVFGAGTGAGSESAKQLANKDGDLASCKESDPDADAPPAQCRTPVRLELMPVMRADATPALADGEVDKPSACPEGMVLAGLKCTPDRSASYECADIALRECEEQCQAGSAPSCYKLAAMHHFGTKAHEKSGAPKDHDKARELYAKACDGGVESACYRHGDMTMTLRMNTNDAGQQAQLAKKAEASFLRACELGYDWGCYSVSSWYLRKPLPGAAFAQDVALGMSLLERSCDLGYPFACSKLAAEKMSGQNTKKDVVAAVSLYKRGCDAGHASDCEAIGDLYATGTGIGKDGEAAITNYERACEAGELRACASAAKLLLDGVAIPKDDNRAVRLLERGCPETGSSGWDACALMAQLYEEGRSLPKDLERAAARYLKGGLTLQAGEIYEKGLQKPDIEKAIEAYSIGCNKFSRDKDRMQNCDHAIRLLEQKDSEEAKRFAGDVCSRMKHANACTRFRALGGK